MRDFINNRRDFDNIKYRKNTKLTKPIEQLKEDNKDFEMNWKIKNNE